VEKFLLLISWRGQTWTESEDVWLNCDLLASMPEFFLLSWSHTELLSSLFLLPECSCFCVLFVPFFLEYYLANEGCYRSFTLLHTTWYNLHGVSRTVIIVHLHPAKEDQRHVTMSGRKLGRQHHRLAVARMHVMCAAAAAQGSLPKQVRVTVVAGRKSMCCVMQAADFWKVTCLTHNTSIIYGVLKQLQLVKVMMKQVRWCM
jgi:hypothetical protein